MSPKGTNERTPPWEQGQSQEPVSFGAWLRRQREMREVPLREIADVTKISLRYLEALEEDRFDVLPAPVFAKGFLREYSRYVGLDSDEVVNSFLTASGEEPEAQTVERETVEGEVRSGRERRVLWMGLTALAAVVALAGLAHVLTRSREAAGPPGSKLAVPVPPPAEVLVPIEPETASDPEPRAPLRVVLDFTGDCWVEAVVDSGRRISELHVQGESMRVDAEETVILTLGNPAAVRVEINGTSYPLDFPAEQVVRDLEIDLALAASLAGGEP